MRPIHTTALLVLTLCGSALGQEAPARPEEKPPLQGPRVVEQRAPHVQDAFSDGSRQGRPGMQIPMRAYNDVINKLRGEKAPADLRLSQSQEEQIGSIEQEYREATRAAAQQNREQRRGQGGEDRPMREMVQEAMRSGPRPGDYQTKIWAVLNEKQQAFVKVELDKVRDDLEKRRSEEAMKRRMEQRQPQQAGQPARPNAQAPATPERRPTAGDDEVRPLRDRGIRLIRRIAQLPPEEREQLLARIEAELDRRGVPDAPEMQPQPPQEPRPPAPERRRDR
jgi:hypothetical protein